MKIEIVFENSIPQSCQTNLKSKIENDFRSGHVSLRPCHSESMVLTMGSSDPLGSTVVGNIKCNCGVVVGIISGTSDGSSLNIKAEQS